MYKLILKKNSALKVADAIQEISRENKALRKEMLTYKYQLSVYENLFPQLEEYKELTKQDIDAMTNAKNSKETDEYSKLNRWISKEDQKTLAIQKLDEL